MAGGKTDALYYRVREGWAWWFTAIIPVATQEEKVGRS
jgi:hypothetical protein